jgi:hypothetical protein
MHTADVWPRVAVIRNANSRRVSGGCLRRNELCCFAAARLRRQADFHHGRRSTAHSCASLILRCTRRQAGEAAGDPEEATAAQRPCLSAVHRGLHGGTPCVASPATAPASPLQRAVTGRRPAAPRILWCVVWVFPSSVVYLSSIYRHCRQAEGRSVRDSWPHSALATHGLLHRMSSISTS